MKPRVIPENILKCMSPKDRRKHGQKTAAEVVAQGEAKSEKELQRSIVALLRLKGIEPIVSRMDRRTSNNVGTPDILFVAGMENGTGDEWVWLVACAWEVKMPQGKLTIEQEAMAKRLTTPPNCWRHRVIRSVDQALAELKKMGIQ